MPLGIMEAQLRALTIPQCCEGGLIQLFSGGGVLNSAPMIDEKRQLLGQLIGVVFSVLAIIYDGVPKLLQLFGFFFSFGPPTLMGSPMKTLW